MHSAQRIKDALLLKPVFMNDQMTGAETQASQLNAFTSKTRFKDLSHIYGHRNNTVLQVMTESSCRKQYND